MPTDIQNDEGISFSLVTSAYPEGILLSRVVRAGDLYSLGRDLDLSSSVEGEQIRLTVVTEAMDSDASWLEKSITLIGSDKMRMPWYLRGEDLYCMLKKM